MARNDRDWMDYALLGSSLAQNAQLSSIGDQLAALKQAESRVMVIRKILFHIEDRIRFFTSQSDFDCERLVGEEVDLKLRHHHSDQYSRPFVCIDSIHPPGTLELTETEQPATQYREAA